MSTEDQIIRYFLEIAVALSERFGLLLSFDRAEKLIVNLVVLAETVFIITNMPYEELIAGNVFTLARGSFRSRKLRVARHGPVAPAACCGGGSAAAATM